LTEALKLEMRRPKGAAPKDAPVIIAEESETEEFVHYYVIWDKFKGVDSEVRSRIVFNSVLAEKPEDLMRLTSAAGLTRAEALETGIARKYS